MNISTDRVSLAMEKQESHSRISDGELRPAGGQRMAFPGLVASQDHPLCVGLKRRGHHHD